MSDVRLTATNPADSSVVPVACNARGELLLEEPIAPPEFDGNLDGDLTVSGSGTFAGYLYGAYLSVDRNVSANATSLTVSDRGTRGLQVLGNGTTQIGGTLSGSVSESTPNISLNSTDGSATFGGDVVVYSRSNQWMLVEQGGLCHMVQQGRPTTAASEYPKLRDVFAELNVIEKALEEVMEKLRMTEPEGWPVWDGSDNS